MSRRRVVFVADDLGFTAGVNDGILAAAAAGNVCEASLAVTGAAVEAGVAAARAAGLGIGLHLSLTLGRALTGPIHGITDRTGRFRSLRSVLLACSLRAVDRDGIAREVTAQLQRLRDLGVVPTHLNGHHHVHVLPGVREVAFAAAARAGIRWTRLPDELPAARRTVSPTQHLLRWWARGARPHVERAGLRWLPFLGLATEAQRAFAAVATRIAGRLPAGDVEWMVHPRTADAALQHLDPDGYRRPAIDELRTLADPGLAARLGLEPVAYSALG